MRKCWIKAKGLNTGLFEIVWEQTRAQRLIYNQEKTMVSGLFKKTSRGKVTRSQKDKCMRDKISSRLFRGKEVNSPSSLGEV